MGNYYYTILVGASILYNLVFMLAAFLSSEGVKNYKIGYDSFFDNMVYACVLLMCVAVFYSLFNMILLAVTGGKAASVGVEPIFFGVLYTLFDLLFISVKRLLMQIVSDAKKTVKSPR